MEHIVQFAIGIDDEAIKKRIIESSEQQILKSIKQDICDKIFEKCWGNRHADPKKDGLSNYSEKLVEDFMNENKDAIIEKAGQYLAERLVRTKAAKELFSK